jgi:hypothetical protein
LISQDKIIQELFKSGGFSLTTVLRCLQSFTRSEIPFHRFLSAPCESNNSFDKDLIRNIMDFTLQAIDGKARTYFNGKFGENLQQSSSLMNSNETNLLVCYQKSVLDFMTLCEQQRLKDNERSSIIPITNLPRNYLLTRSNGSIYLLNSTAQKQLSSSSSSLSQLFSSFGDWSQRAKLVDGFIDDRFTKKLLSVKCCDNELRNFVSEFVSDYGSKGFLSSGLPMEVLLLHTNSHQSLLPIIEEEIQEIIDSPFFELDLNCEFPLFGNSAVSARLLSQLATRTIRDKLHHLMDWLFAFEYFTRYSCSYFSMKDLSYLNSFLKEKVRTLFIILSVG